MELETLQRQQEGLAFNELIEQANRSHEETMAAGSHARGALLRIANAMRSTGIFLLRLRESDQAKHGKWEKLFASANGRPNPNSVLDFDSQTGRNYMAVADRHPNEITDGELPEVVRTISDILVAIGVKRLSGRGQQQGSDDDPLAKVETDFGRFLATLNKQKEIHPVSLWPTDRREYWKAKLKPIMEIYQQL